MIESFIKKFTEEKVEYEQVGNAFYQIPEKLKAIQLRIEPEMRGILLGEIKNNKFFPSLPLLDILSKTSKDKVHVKDIGEMDFLYGKGLRKRHIQKVDGEPKVGFMKLIMNKYGNCLGYGKIVKDLNKVGTIVKNILDKGDYLRREKD